VNWGTARTHSAPQRFTTGVTQIGELSAWLSAWLSFHNSYSPAGGDPLGGTSPAGCRGRYCGPSHRVSAIYRRP
ncbi:uncharacterized protein METZ01_LOCUS270050, partial [marine metagenome]